MKKKLFNIKSKCLISVIGFLLCLAFVFAIPLSAKASASFSLTPVTGSYITGNTFSVSFNVDSDGQAINAAVGDLTFDKTKLSVSSIDTSSSIFKIWVEYPSFSNTSGTIHFAGGAPSPGFTGTASIFTINFKGLSLGGADVSVLIGGKVLLNDGTGTNILGSASGGSYNILPFPLSVSCSASPNLVLQNQPTIFTASASGGEGNYIYSWSPDCTEGTNKCSVMYNALGTKTTKVTVTSALQTASASCSVDVVLPDLSVSCLPSLPEVDTNKPVTFVASPIGGNGVYTFSWLNACTGTNSTCTNTYDTYGLKVAKVTVISGGKTVTSTCLTDVNLVCPILDSTTGSGHGTVEVLPENNASDNNGDNNTAVALVSKTQNLDPIIQSFVDVVNTPLASASSKAISTTGLAVVTASAILFSPFSWAEIFLLPFRLLVILLTALGLKKRTLPWGVVYDSVTKQPIDPAHIMLKDVNGKDITSAITDLDGRYGFLAQPNIYKLMVKRSNYAFPSQKLFGKNSDEIYTNLYFGQNIEVKNDQGVIARNIPLDPLNFDWNQFIKKEKKLIKFYSNADIFLRKISSIFFVIGFTVSIISFFAAPYLYNIIILGLYLLLLLIRSLGIKPLSVGYIKDKKTGNPLSFAIIRVVISDLNVDIAHKIADKYGRYYCLVPKGQYYVKIEKKNDDGTYSLVYTSDIIYVSQKGIIRKTFNV